MCAMNELLFVHAYLGCDLTSDVNKATTLKAKAIPKCKWLR